MTRSPRWSSKGKGKDVLKIILVTVTAFAMGWTANSLVRKRLEFAQMEKFVAECDLAFKKAKSSFEDGERIVQAKEALGMNEKLRIQPLWLEFSQDIAVRGFSNSVGTDYVALNGSDHLCLKRDKYKSSPNGSTVDRFDDSVTVIVFSIHNGRKIVRSAFTDGRPVLRQLF